MKGTVFTPEEIDRRISAMKFTPEQRADFEAYLKDNPNHFEIQDQHRANDRAMSESLMLRAFMKVHGLGPEDLRDDRTYPPGR